MTSLLSTLIPLAGIRDALPDVGWIVAGAIVVVGLLVFGLTELRRLSVTRIWAIGGVCFRESVRRRVLWIIPLAIAGVVVVSQLQRAFDEQDVIRQTTKFCLFASGMVVVLVCVILACTNLPREIDSRVIYTVVTKPTTRLELILGKIVGFSRVSALILIVMGVFTYGYLTARTWAQEQVVATRLATDPGLSPVQRSKLEHYRESGLLTARTYEHADVVQVMASQSVDGSPQALPEPADPIRSIYGDQQEELLFRFALDPQRFFGDPTQAGQTSAAEGIGKNGLMIALRIHWYRYGPQSQTQINTMAVGAAIGVDILDPSGYSLISAVNMPDPQHPTEKAANCSRIELPRQNKYDPLASQKQQAQLVWAYVPPAQAAQIYAQPFIYVHVIGDSHNVQYFASGYDVAIMPAPALAIGQLAPPAPQVIPVSELIGPVAAPNGRPYPPSVRGRFAVHGGQELTGEDIKNPHAAYAIFHFGAGSFASSPQNGGEIPLEVRTGIDENSDALEEDETATNVSLIVRTHPASGPPQLGQPVNIKTENRQVAFASIPVSEIGNGDFDILARCNSLGHVMAVDATSVAVMTGEEPFVWNLFKSLFILWMLTVLVVTLAIFTSTFVSWPIAVVLTVVLLLGHWAVTQVADVSDNTLGRSIATDMGLTDPSKAEAVATSVNALSGTLQVVGTAMPDIDRFSAVGSIEEGTIVSNADVADAAGVLLGFAVPAAVLAFVILKKKEVAP